MLGPCFQTFSLKGKACWAASAPHPQRCHPQGARRTGLAVGALPAAAADACVGVDAIDAGAAVSTGVALTVVNVCGRRGHRTWVNAGRAMPPPALSQAFPAPPEKSHPAPPHCTPSGPSWNLTAAGEAGASKGQPVHSTGHPHTKLLRESQEETAGEGGPPYLRRFQNLLKQMC